MKKRVMSALLALCLCLTLLPGTAFAAEPATQTADFTADEGTAALKLLNETKTGQADSSWDNSTKTLTLNGIDFTTTATTAVKLPGGSTIVLADGATNTIKGGDATANQDGGYNNKIYVCGIYAMGDLTIKGDTAGTGALSVTSGTYTNTGNARTCSTAIYGNGDLNVKGGTITANGGKAVCANMAFSDGVELENGSLTVSGGTLIGIGGESIDTGKETAYPSFSQGISLSVGNISVTGGKLEGRSTLTGEFTLDYGIRLYSGSLTVSDNGEVLTEARIAIGISSGNLNLTGGEITVIGRGEHYSAVSIETGMSGNKDCGNIKIKGGTLTITGGVYMSQYNDSDKSQGQFTVTGGMVETGQVYGAREIAVSGGMVETGNIETDTMTLSGGKLLIREPVHEGGSGNLYAGSAITCHNGFTVSNGTLDVAWDWGTHTPVVFPVDSYRGYAKPLVHIGSYNVNNGNEVAAFNGGTTILNTGCAGNTALRVKNLTLGSNVNETGADTGSSGEHRQEYSDTPVVFSDMMNRTPVTVSDVTAQSKTYDGTTTATLTGTLNSITGSDQVFLGSAKVTANFDNANVGSNKSVTVAGGTFDLRGKDAYKYVLNPQFTNPSDLKANITACPEFTDATNKTQTIYVGESSFAAPKFTGVTVGGKAEEVTGSVAYTLNGESKTVKEIGEALKVLKAGEKLDIGYTFTAKGNYIGEKTGTITVMAQERPSSGGGSHTSSYPVALPGETQNGSVTVDRSSAGRGDTVTITVNPDSGYVLETLAVTDKNGSEINLTDKGNGKYTFTMPGSRVEIKATFMEDNSVLNFFYDVPSDSFCYEAVKWAVEKDITSGVGNNLFAPAQPCTRAQAVTFLWRAAGNPVPRSTVMPFTDVPADSYYYDAVLWAIENGIAVGTGVDKFSPDMDCTRAQIVTFLWRSENSPVAGSGDSFTDVAADAYYADAVLWANNHGITAGIGNSFFEPDNSCTRAQIVTFLYRISQR